jgi:hypothetical protein
MKQKGIPCLMTFHQSEHRRGLTRIADDSDYFAVAPRKSENTKEKFKWLETVFHYLHGREAGGEARKKIHGLGISSPEWMMQFPFYSVDNTAWLQSFRSHSRAQFNTASNRTKYMSLEDWEERARDCDMPTTYLREMLGYAKRGERSDPEGNSGYYWLMKLAMDAAVETERRITDSWQQKGVVWHEQKPIAVAERIK